MNTFTNRRLNMHYEDHNLSALLRASRPAPALPPRFQQNVWRRVEAATTPAEAGSWLDALAALILKPRLAFASLSVLILAGGLLGLHAGSQTIQQTAEARYIAAVAPNAHP